MITKNEFINRIQNLPKTIPSKSGKASYTDFILKGNNLSFKRVEPQSNWVLDIELLWKVYSTQQYINTTVVKEVTGGRVNSPSIALLMAIECIDKKGNRI